MHRVVERILNLLAFLLTARRPVSAEEIRRTVAGYDQEGDQAFRRTFERDKDLLRQLGIPIRLAPTDAWEVEFGYVVSPKEYQLRDPGLTDEERAALWLAAQAVRLGGQAPGLGAIFKLGGAPLAAAGEPLAADLGQQADELGTAFTAVVERRLLSFTYHDKQRSLRPYGLVHQRSHWYVVGEPVGGKGVRAFRIDRASGVQMLEPPKAFERPKGFRASDSIPDAPWEAGSDDLMAKVRFDREAAWWARRQLTARTRLEVDADGALVATLPVANPEALVGWILGFEDAAEVLDPPELRERVLARVRGTA
ncbi:MAG: helix-turn-helix transcriptional regulator [Acidimicrobiia bacterium]